MSTNFPLQRINRWARVTDPALLPGVAVAEINLQVDDLCIVGPVVDAYIDYICTNPAFPATWRIDGFCCGTDPSLIPGQTLYLDEVDYFDFNGSGRSDWWSQVHVAAPGDTSQPLDVFAQPIVANRPTATTINGFRAARFNGSTQWLVQQLRRSIIDVIPPDDFTLFFAGIVHAAPAAVTPQTGAGIFSSNDEACVLGVFHDAGQDWIGVRTQSATDDVVVQLPITLGQFLIVSASRSPVTGELTLACNGVSTSAAANPAVLSANAVVIGAVSSAGALPCQVDVASISCHGSLASTAIQSITEYFLYKYVLGPQSGVAEPDKPLPINYDTVTSATGIWDERGQTFVAGALTKWTNQKGGGKDWDVNPFGVVITATTLNGLAALNLPGTDGTFFISAAVMQYTDLMTAAQGCIITVIQKPVNGGGGSLPSAEAIISDTIAEADGSWYTVAGVRKNGTILQTSGGVNRSALLNNSYEFGTGYTDIGGYDGTSIWHTSNGAVDKAAQSGNVNDSTGQWVFGAQYNAPRYAVHGVVGCLLTFNAWPGWATVQGVRSFCAGKWGVA